MGRCQRQMCPVDETSAGAGAGTATFAPVAVLVVDDAAAPVAAVAAVVDVAVHKGDGYW